MVQLRGKGGKQAADRKGKTLLREELGAVSFLFSPFLLPFLLPGTFFSPGAITPEARRAVPSRGEVRSMEAGLAGWRRGCGRKLAPSFLLTIPCQWLSQTRVFYIGFRWEVAKMQIPEPLSPAESDH